MADLKIRDLTAGGAAQPTDMIPVERADETNARMTPQSIAASARGVLKDDGDDGYTAISGDDILADTSNDSWTINVPDDGAVGMWFKVTDATDSFATNPLTIGKNGQTIMDLDEDQSISTKGACVEYFHNGTTWRIRGVPLD